MHINAMKMNKCSQIIDTKARKENESGCFSAPSAQEMQEKDGQDQESIAVIGMSGVFPDAENLTQFWQNLAQEKNCIQPQALANVLLDDRIQMNRVYVKSRTDVPKADYFDAKFFSIPPQEARLLDPQQRILLELTWKAIEDAGYDPLSFTERVGVFAGVNLNTYFINNILQNQQARESISDAQVAILCEKDYISARLAYQLNLTGCCVTVQAACATSLVAIHLASESLLSQESDLAIAAASSIRSPLEQGYYYDGEGIVSPDGNCRSFAGNANGTVYSSAAGVVVMKRLSDALRDRDMIYGVIRATAVNNDGSDKMNFTSPSEQKQVEVMEDALSLAGLSPASIHYIEGHGTGTALGDAIELAALRRVYGPHQTVDNNDSTALGVNPLRPILGSVKANIGHAQNASGMAGFIKCMGILTQRSIPAMPAHCREMNKDLSNDSFLLNSSTVNFTQEEGPIRLAISAFSLGGTNAHAILEEGPKFKYLPTANSIHILPISGKSSVSLVKNVQQLEGDIQRIVAESEREETEYLSDISYTLQVGRHDFDYRLAIVSSNVEDTLKQLKLLRESLSSIEKIHKKRARVFLFPGMGDFNAKAGQELYQHMALYRKYFEQCCQLVNDITGLDLSQALPYIFCSEPLTKEQEQALFLCWQKPSIAYCAIFSLEYSLAKMVMALGIEPDVMIGYSVGEYVAACLTGIFEPSQAIELLWQRGKLIETLPEGRMLTVLQTEDYVRPLLSETLSFSAFNSNNVVVVSGPEGDILTLSQTLWAKGVACKVIESKYAFHSNMMAPILAEYQALVAAITLKAPEGKTYISGVTGQWLKPEEAVDPAYWAQHILNPIVFSEAITTFYSPEVMENIDSAIFLEFGVGSALASFIHQDGKLRHKDASMSLLPSRYDLTGEVHFLLTRLAQLWTLGESIKWAELHHHYQPNKIRLTPYAFDQQKYWIEPDISPLTEEISLKNASNNVTSIWDEITFSPTASYSVSDSADEPPLSKMMVLSVTERKILTIWKTVLGYEVIQPDESFFELGGSSLLAIQIINDIKKIFSVELSLADFYQVANVRQMSAAIDELLDRKIELSDSSLTTAQSHSHQRFDAFPLTDVQYAYWIGRQKGLILGNVATHIYWEFDVETFDLARFEQAWNRLIERHDMLRAIIQPDGQQRVLKDPQYYHIEIEDLSELAPEAVEQRLLQKRHTLSHHIMLTDCWPLFEIKASYLPKGIRMHVGIDLLIADAWSIMGILANELSILYKTPDAKLAELTFNFRDYVIAESAIKHSTYYQRSKNYWTKRRDTLPGGPDLPLKVSPATIDKPHFNRREFHLSASAWHALKQQARKISVTPSVVLCTLYAEVLRYWSQSDKFTLNVTLFNRMPIHDEVANIVGDFTSLTLLEIDLAECKTFKNKVQTIQQQLWCDMDHRYVSGVEVIRDIARHRSDSGQFAVPVVFTSIINQTGEQSEPRENFLDEISALEDNQGTVFTVSQTPQIWLDHQVVERNGQLITTWDAIDELFPDGFIDNMFQVYVDTLRHLAEQPASWFDAMPPLLSKAQQQCLDDYNNTKNDWPEKNLHQDFLKQVTLRPDAAAILTETRCICYGELAGLANAVQCWLQKAGAKPGDRVAIVMEKGWQQIVAVLGCLQTACVYIPIHASTPAKRLDIILADAECHFVLTTANLQTAFPSSEQKCLLSVDSVIPLSDAKPVTCHPHSLAYIIYTSGSTGKPKGVMVSHRSAMNTIVDINHRVALSERDRVFAISHLNFDLSVYDIFGPLSAGAALVIPSESDVRDPSSWLNLINKTQVTIWNSVPALMEMMATYLAGLKVGLPESLRVILLSGDWIPMPLAKSLLEWSKDLPITLYSLGGATEASIWSIIHPIQEQDLTKPSIPYGKPLANQSIYVLDKQLEPKPIGVIGDIFIGGIGLADGYFNDVKRTEQSFIRHPKNGERLYKTGDLGRYLDSNVVEFIGREDFQVKISGYRIELGEIEAVINTHPAVQSAAVVIDNHGDEKQLVGFVVMNETDPPYHNENSDAVPIDFSEQISRDNGFVGISINLPVLERLVTNDKGFDKSAAILSTASPAVFLARLLFDYCCIELENVPLPKYQYASAGSLYSVRILVSVTPRQNPLARILAIFDPKNYQLDCWTGSLDTLQQETLGSVDITFSLMGVDSKVRPLYGEWTDDFIAIEAGQIACLLIQAIQTMGMSAVLNCQPQQGVNDILLWRSYMQLSKKDHVLAMIEITDNHCNRSIPQQLATIRYDVDDLRLDFIKFQPQVMEKQIVLIDPIQRMKFKQQAEVEYSPCLYQLKLNDFIDKSVDSQLTKFCQRRSYRHFLTQPLSNFAIATISEATSSRLTLQSFSTLLHKFQQGKSLMQDGSISEFPAIQIYAYIKQQAIVGIAQGFYHVDVETNSLTKISPHRLTEQAFAKGENAAIYARGSFALFLVADLKTCTHYNLNQAEQSALRTRLHMEVGAACALLEKYAPDCNIGLCQIGSFEYSNIASLLPLADDQLYLHCLVGGPIDDSFKSYDALVEANQYSRELAELAKQQVEPLDLSKLHMPAVSTLSEEHLQSINIDNDKKMAWEETLMDYAYAQLPHYMVPTKIVVLDSMPLTENGKIDRKALLKQLVRSQVKAISLAPRSKMEAEIADIVKSVLSLQHIDINDNFFEMGGNSVQLVKIHALLREKLSQPVEIVDLFEHPTVLRLSEYFNRQNNTLAFLPQDQTQQIMSIQERMQERKSRRSKRK